MRGLVVDLEAPYFASFRRPASTSLVATYPVPPFTTLLGLFLNALGVPRWEYEGALARLQGALRLNLRPLRLERPPVREMARLLKMIEREEGARVVGRRASFPSSPVFRDLLVRPAYRVYLGGEEGVVREVAEAVRRPARPLYLGRSDDPVVVDPVWEGEVEEVAGQEAWALVPGLYEGGEALRLPLAFRDGRSPVYSPILTLPPRFPFSLPEPQRLYRFGEEAVHLLPEG